MAKAIIILAVIATAFGAVIKNEDVPLQRIARSPCSTCGSPPSPPILHTQNWSGLARSADGLQNTVFSGAAAAADQSPLAGGEAFSLASSSAGAGLGDSANSGSIGSGSVGVGARFGNSGAGFERSSGATYGGSSGVKGSFAADGYGAGHKGSGGGYKESSYLYQSRGSKDFSGLGASQQDGQTAASGSSSFAAQGGSLGGNKDVTFGSNGGVHSGAFRGRGDDDVEETQSQYKGSFSGRTKNEHFEGHGAYQRSNHQNGQVGDFNSALSSGQSLSYGGNRGGAGNGNLEYGYLSENQRKEGSSFIEKERGYDHGYSGTGLSSGHDLSEGNSFGDTAGQGNYGSGLSTYDAERRGGYGINRGGASQGYIGSGISSEGRRDQSEEQARYRAFGSQKQGRRFDASESQSSSSAGGLGSTQYQGSRGNQGLLQVSGSGSGLGQGGYGSGSLGSLGQQGYLGGSGTSDAQSALSGALNLASQGLQTSSQAGCATCGKSSYALSNAKSHSGSAVALSIGG